MKRSGLLLGFVLFFIFQGYFFPQFTPDELALRWQQEECLKNADIVRFEEIGEGVTRPFRVYLEGEIGKFSGCWKNPRGIQKGFLEGWQYEIAAYELDKLVGLNMVPPTVERELGGKAGSLQFWTDTPMNDLERMEKQIKIPRDKLEAWSKAKYLQRAFDCLIGNEDRTQENIRYTEDWRMILIDHSRSFRSSPKYTDHLMYGRNGIKEQKLFRVLPRVFVKRLEALTIETVSNAVGTYLSAKEVRSLLKRRDILLAEINTMIKEKGEKNTLY
jgi:hypothetical protein